MTFPSDFAEHEILSAMDCLLNECCPKVVIIGGPGQGKSTLGQQLAQVHRAKLLGKPYDCQPYNFQPQIERIPFRVVLKYFAQWLADNPNLDDLEAYLAERVGKLAARPGTVSPEDVQEILGCRPCLLILDGLDEVVASDLQERMLARIQDFINRAEQLNANLMVVATSRPKEYKDKYEKHFAPEEFWHLELHKFSPEKVIEYSEKWIPAKISREEEQKRVLSTFKECWQDGSTSALLTTPLQVTIILLIIKDGGNPPSQREALFSEYWGTIFRREKSKAKEVIQSDESILFDLHGYLGYILHRRAAEENVQSLLPEEDFKQAVRQFLRKKDRRSPDDTINSKMEQLFSGRDRLVLIVEPQQGLFGFELRSFQEFFAAVHLAQTAIDTQQRFERLKAIACSAHWRNVALFFAGRIARNFSGEASNVLELVCRPVDRGEPNRHLRPGAWLALEIAADSAFSANRDLQYNAVEYGLEVLNTGLTEEQQQELSSLTKRLSEEDQRDILRSVLQEKLHCLPVGCLEVALDLHGQHFGSTRFFQEKIDALLATQQQSLVLSALNLAIRYKSDPLWMVEQLQLYWSYCKKDISEAFFRSYNYTEKLLNVWSLSEAEATELAEAIFESRWLYHTLHSPEEVAWNMPEPKTHSEQLILMLRCFSVISYLKRQIVRGPEIELGEGDAILLPVMAVRMRKSRSKTLLLVPDDPAKALNHLLQLPDLIPWLRVSLWTLFWLINKPNQDNLSVFVESFRSIQKPLALFKKLWFYSGLRETWPLLALAVERQKTEGHETVSNLLPFLEANSQISIAEQVVGTIREYVKKSDKTQQKRFFTALRAQIGLNELLPQLIPLANQIGTTVEELVGAHIEVYSCSPYDFEQSECATAHLENLLKTTEKYINQGKNSEVLLMCIIEEKWPYYTPFLVKKAQKILEKIIDNYSNFAVFSVADLSVTLFLKILAYDTQVQQIASRLFTIIQLNELLKIKLWPIRKVIDELDCESLSVLQSFLNHEQETVRVGGSLLLKAIIDSTVHYPEARKNEFKEFKKIRLDSNLGKSLVDDHNNTRRLVGIALLTLSDYPVEDVKYRNLLLNNLKQSQTAEEEKAWNQLLQKISMDEKQPMWSQLLEEILGKPWSYSKLVLSNAMERYKEISKIASVTIPETEERALGLL